jgi:N-acetyl-gamma-glutamylphosphate reductase
MAKIFATGITGYIGGDAIYAIVTAHPEYEVSALVRDKEKGAEVVKAHPNIRIVHGELEDSELLEEEASKADIILRKCNIWLLLNCSSYVLYCV